MNNQIPNNPNIKVLKAKSSGLFTNYIYKAIPLAFDESMSYYETLCGLLAYLKNTIIPTVNNNAEVVAELQKLYVKLKNYVDNYFTNLDVQNEINNKLDEMVQNGELQTILNNLIITKGTFRSKLEMSKIGRLNLSDYLSAGYVSPQAGVFIGDHQYIFTFIKDDSVGSAKLIKVNFELGKIVDENDVEGIFHGNGACIKDNSIFYCQSFDNTGQNKYNIVEVNPDNLEVINTYPINFNDKSEQQILAIGYDQKYDKFYLIGYNYFYRCDTNFNVEEIIKFDKEYLHESGLRQGGTFYEDYVCYISNSENAIICYNRDGSLHHIIDLGFKQLSNVFGEIENITVINNKLYFHSNLVFSVNPSILLVQFFYADLGGGGLPQLNTSSSLFQTNLNINTIVNKTAYNKLSDYDKFTSNGSTAKPYETLGECLQNLDNSFCTTILIQDTSDYNEIVSIYNRNVIIKGGGAKIKSLKIVNSRVAITSLVFNHSTPRSYMYGDQSQKYNTPLYITYNSYVTLLGNTGFNKQNCINDNMEYRYVCEGSTLNDNSISNTELGITKFTNTGLNDLDYYPLILYNSQLNTVTATNIKTNNVRRSIYRVIENVQGDQTFNMSNINGYYNMDKGFYVAINVTGIGNTNFEKISSFNNSRFIVLDSPTAKYMFQIYADPTANTMKIIPYKHNGTSWVHDQTFNYYPFYEFDI